MSPESRKTYAVELRSGTIFAGRYEIQTSLGAGRAAEVYKAVESNSGRTVALKLLRTSAARDRRAAGRYRRDLEAARNITHGSFVRILDVSEDGGTPYVVLEYVDGVTLEEWRRQRPRIAVTEFQRIFRPICDAAGFLHSRGLVHGDISSRNVLIQGDGSPKLMDFGILRCVEKKPLTPAADVRSLGVIAFELLTGAAVAPESDLSALRAPDLRISPGLAGVIEKCLERDPGRRYPDAAALGAAIAGGPAFAAPVQPLSTLLPVRPPSLSFAVRLLGSVASRLQAIHKAGLSHPNLSPGNILASPVGSVEIPMRPVPPPQASILITEPKYIAPEQLMGHASPGDPAHVSADIYMLGFLTYEMLCPPAEFERQFQNLPAGGLGWMTWHADKTQRLRPLPELAPECPSQLWQLLERMTEKDTAKRIGSLEEVAATATQLGRLYEKTECVALPAVPAAAPASKPLRRAALGIACCAAAAGLFFAGSWLWSSGAVRRISPVISAWTAGIAARLHGTARESQPARIRTAAGEMSLIPGGTFLMGNDSVANEAPEHKVTLPPFYLDRFEVTNALYNEFAARTHRPLPGPPAWDSEYLSKSGHPVLNVSWADARDFCAFAGKRLPSEAEWERAARGGGLASTQWANWTAPGLANLQGDGAGKPAAVGAFQADVSPEGIYDLAGNVHEWVADDYRLYAGSGTRLEKADGPRKAVRGGSFALRPPNLSPSWRASLAPDLPAGRDLPVGFRCAAGISIAAQATSGPGSR